MAELLRPMLDIRVLLAGALVVTALAGYGLLSLAVKGELPKSTEKAGQLLGGVENLGDLKEYVMCDTLNYCDKKNHAERSKKNDQGQHDKWWAKQK